MPLCQSGPGHPYDAIRSVHSVRRLNPHGLNIARDIVRDMRYVWDKPRQDQRWTARITTDTLFRLSEVGVNPTTLIWKFTISSYNKILTTYLLSLQFFCLYKCLNCTEQHIMNGFNLCTIS